MRTRASRDQVLNFGIVLAGLLVAFLLLAPLFATLAWGEELGSTPGLALIGVAVLVMLGTIIAGPAPPHRNVSRLRNALAVLGVVLSIVGAVTWR